MLLVANSGGATGSVCRVFSGRRCYRTEPDTYSLPPYMTCQTSVSFHHHFFPRIDFIPGGLRRRYKIVSSRPDDGKRRHLAQILRSFRDVEERASNTEHGRQQPYVFIQPFLVLYCNYCRSPKGINASHGTGMMSAAELRCFVWQTPSPWKVYYANNVTVTVTLGPCLSPPPSQANVQHCADDCEQDFQTRSFFLDSTSLSFY